MSTGPLTWIAVIGLLLFALAWARSGAFRHRTKNKVAVLVGVAIVLICLDAVDSPVLAMLQSIDYGAIVRAFDVPE